MSEVNGILFLWKCGDKVGSTGAKPVNPRLFFQSKRFRCMSDSRNVEWLGFVDLYGEIPEKDFPLVHDSVELN